MSDTAVDQQDARTQVLQMSPNRIFEGGNHIVAILVFLALLVFGLFWTVRGLTNDIADSGTPDLAWGAFVLLGIALLIALALSSSTASTIRQTRWQRSFTRTACNHR